MVRTDEVKSLPTEYYLFRWFSFDRNNKIITKNLPIKPYLVDSDNFQSGSFYTSRIIKGFFTEEDSTQIIQDERKVYNSLLSCQSIENVNQKIRNDTYLKEHNVSIGLNDLTKGSWEGLLNTQIDNLPMDNAGKGEQCVVKTRLSFSSSNIPAKAEKVILIEEPECHLSHSTLNTLLSLIGKESKTYQVITTTHSSFVANKLGLNNLILLHDSKSLKLNELDKETNSFFEKISGFDTLRLVLSKKAVLVEGASDELIFQRAYMDFHGGRIPLYDGIDVISVGLAFKRFLSISQSLSLKTIVITDNDGDLTAIHKKYDEYENCHNIFISYSKHINMPRDFSNPQGLSIKNLNTLEPEIVSANKGNLPLLFSVLNLKPVDESSLIKYMVANKTEMALRIFTSNKNISYPQYIIDAVKKCDDK